MNKEKEQFEIASKLKWYGELLKFSEEEKPEEAKEYVTTIKEEILNTNVYVYTPTGDVIDLPKGATPLDFAYKIHTNIGNKTVGAMVNNRIVPLDYELKNGNYQYNTSGKINGENTTVQSFDIEPPYLAVCIWKRVA